MTADFAWPDMIHPSQQQIQRDYWIILSDANVTEPNCRRNKTKSGEGEGKACQRPSWVISQQPPVVFPRESAFWLLLTVSILFRKKNWTDESSFPNFN